MDTESFKNACNGKSASAGGLNLPEFKRDAIQLYPAHKDEINVMSRKQLEDFCKQQQVQSPRRQLSPIHVKPSTSLMQSATQIKASSGIEKVPSLSSKTTTTNCLRDLIEKRDYRGRTELHKAVNNNEINFIKFLLKAGVDINITDNYGNTPITMFPIVGDDYIADHLETLKFLITSGANINSKGESGTILTQATKSGAVQIARFLIEHGANINVMDINGNTPLHHAVDKGHSDIVRLLLDNHADIIKNNWGYTPLDFAKENGDENGDENIVEMLREYVENIPQIKEPGMD
jgi:ankyrin repeat protein